MIKALFAFMLMALAIGTGCYFVLRTKDQREKDYRDTRKRFTEGWNKSVAYVRNLRDTRKPTPDLCEMTSASSRVA